MREGSAIISKIREPLSNDEREVDRLSPTAMAVGSRNMTIGAKSLKCHQPQTGGPSVAAEPDDRHGIVDDY